MMSNVLCQPSKHLVSSDDMGAGKMTVQIPWKKIFQFLYAPFFWVLDFFMRNYRLNRERLEKLIGGRKISALFRGAAIVLLVVWIAIFSFASDESRNRLTQEIKAAFENISSK